MDFCVCMCDHGTLATFLLGNNVGPLWAKPTFGNGIPALLSKWSRSNLALGFARPVTVELSVGLRNSIFQFLVCLLLGGPGGPVSRRGAWPTRKLPVKCFLRSLLPGQFASFNVCYLVTCVYVCVSCWNFEQNNHCFDLLYLAIFQKYRISLCLHHSTLRWLGNRTAL